MSELEKKTERYLTEQVKKIGGQCLKMSPTYNNGIPDRQVLYKGRAVFVELKKKGKKPRKLQVKFMEELKKADFETIVIDDRDAVDALIVALTHELPVV